MRHSRTEIEPLHILIAWNAVAQNVSQWWGSYTLRRCINNWHVYAAHMSPAVNRSFVLQHFYPGFTCFNTELMEVYWDLVGRKLGLGWNIPLSVWNLTHFSSLSLPFHPSHLSVSLLTSHGADELLKSFFIFSQLHHQQPHQCSVECCSTAHVHVTVCDTKEGKVLLLQEDRWLLWPGLTHSCSFSFKWFFAHKWTTEPVSKI